jgi:hypothetical protein
VHGASDATGQESDQSKSATVQMAKIVKELGVPVDIIGRMVVTPPEQMVWLSPNTLTSFNGSSRPQMIQGKSFLASALTRKEAIFAFYMPPAR